MSLKYLSELVLTPLMESWFRPQNYDISEKMSSQLPFLMRVPPLQGGVRTSDSSGPAAFLVALPSLGLLWPCQEA